MHRVGGTSCLYKVEHDARYNTFHALLQLGLQVVRQRAVKGASPPESIQSASSLVMTVVMTSETSHRFVACQCRCPSAQACHQSCPQQSVRPYIGLVTVFRRSIVLLQVISGLQAGVALPLALLVICCWVGAAEGKATTVSIAKFLGRSDAAVRSYSRNSKFAKVISPTAVTWRCITCQGGQLCAVP